MAEVKKRNPLFIYFLRFLRDRFNLSMDQADEEETIEYIRKGVEFKGPNLWILIFAIFVASIGLNVNSTAVIIGAMLISPLMGPILGIGMGVGINDFELIKKSMKNLGIAVTISVLTSAFYFFISPLSDAQSELLARTNPTIWDVFIALFGGLAGIVAGSRKEKSNAIPGVAIATALMPPLCTAGYGLATFNLYYFFGAFYLFFINSVFISLSTYVIVRLMKYPKKTFVNREREKKVKAYIVAFVVITILPSIYLGFVVVKRSVFERNSINFVQKELNFPNTKVIGRVIDFDSDPKKIEVSIFGERVDAALIENAVSKLEDYQLAGTEVKILQGFDEQANLETIERFNQSLKVGIIEDLYRKNEDLIRNKDRQIRLLEEELIRMKAAELPVADISRELKAQHPNVVEFSISNTYLARMDSIKMDTLYLAVARYRNRPSNEEQKRLENWLKARIKSDNLKLVLSPY